MERLIDVSNHLWEVFCLKVEKMFYSTAII